MTKQEIINRLNDHLRGEVEELTLGRFHKKPVPRITLADGTTMSVQAGEWAYCLPRTNYGPYSHVEIGFPSKTLGALAKYAETPEDPLETVYGYVPIDELADEILLRGGFAGDRP